MFFNQISKVDFIKIINNLTTNLRTLSNWEIIKKIKLLTYDKLHDDPFFRPVFHPFEIQAKQLFDSLHKKFFFYLFFICAF
jgi:hypothetical protein